MGARAPDAPAPLLQIAGPADFAAAFAADQQTIQRLDTYAALLRRWQGAVNLVARESLAGLWQRHFADSAQLLRLAPGARRWLDLGTGAGFPGLVIAILGAPQGINVTLVEAAERKCAFLSEVARQTGVAVEIRNERIESFGAQRTVGPFEAVTARGLAPLAALIGLAAPFFGSDTVGLFAKGKGAAGEVEAANRAWTFHVKLVPSQTDRHARIVEVREPVARS